ncbi:hypothetical protein ONS95_009092 [Cadophora gregata]|uniref:uncharacterized protein n=1 Tax=Cadophora gregata TaxID=51156 RepID=UPI0026DAFA71|nr:uncharacterized protein ONS95_009092 [Cadophora gregata]KAK0124109.1 hypothetical protein ONS95_009092 [Cadophora gregata]
MEGASKAGQASPRHEERPKSSEGAGSATASQAAAVNNPPSPPRAASSATSPPNNTTNTEDAVADEIAIDDGFDADSAFGDDVASDTTSLASAISRGYVENGRKYQSTKGHEYWGPSDDKQFETFELGHLLYIILDKDMPEPLFHSPIGDGPQNILDIGTGDGTWAIEVADKYPSATVYGVDLYPPPAVWVPPNCVFQVDDVTQEWTWNKQFDLIHLRLLLGAFTPEERDRLYKECYDNLAPGGWIEEVELDVRVMSDDDSLDPNSILAGWGPNFLGCAERAGRPLDTQLTMKSSIEKAGFVNVQDKLYKCPLGSWPALKVFKDAGKVNMEHWKAGLEGWAMFLLTKFGEPTPWTAEQVHVYVAQVRNEISQPHLHCYHYTRRVWAQKPLT